MEIFEGNSRRREKLISGNEKKFQKSRKFSEDFQKENFFPTLGEN